MGRRKKRIVMGVIEVGLYMDVFGLMLKGRFGRIQLIYIVSCLGLSQPISNDRHHFPRSVERQLYRFRVDHRCVTPNTNLNPSYHSRLWQTRSSFRKVSHRPCLSFQLSNDISYKDNVQT
jgi:hypothetical protein